MIRVAVVDDEELARRRLLRLLRDVPEVAVAGEAHDGESALAMVARCAPDLLLLDVCMPGLDGMSLARRHLGELPPVVFVTAHNEYAVQAFEVRAVDYLLKPVRPERLAAAIARARQGAVPAERAWQAADAAASTAHSSRIVATARGVVRFFDARALSRLWSQDKYTVFRADGHEHLTEEPLAALEARLRPHGFVRVHRAELVNLATVRAMHAEDSGVVLELADGQRAQVSRRSLPQVRAALGL